MNARLEGEFEDLRLLALAASTVPLTWWLLLAWTWPMTLGGHDELAQNLLFIREIASSGRGWSSLVYRPDLLGGSVVRDVIGPFPLFALFAHLGSTPTAISVLSSFVVQSLLGFLGCRTARDMAAVWGAPRRLTLPEVLGAIWLSAFAPVLGWRFGHGHLNLVVGLLAFATGLALIASAAARRQTATLLAVASLAFVLALLHSGQQVVLYGLVFGGPVLVGSWLSLRGGWRLGAVLLPAVGAILISLPALWPMLAHARASDAPRGLGEGVVVYDFVTSTSSDWITSLPWTTASLPSGRDTSLHHEVNYPMGPLVVPLALLPWRRTRALAVGLGSSLTAALVFSMHVEPWSHALLASLPPLRSFRVPARAVLPFLWALPAIAAAALIACDEGAAGPAPVRADRRSAEADRSASRRPRAFAIASVCALVLFLSPSVVREAGVWLLAIATVALLRRRPPGVPAGAVLLALGACSLGAFHERLLPFENGGALLAEASEIGAALRRAKPELGSSLSRIRLDFEIPAFAANTAFAAGISSVDGYATPTRRFAELLFALRKAPYQPTAVFFELRPDEPAFRALRQLYDVRWRAALPSPGSLALSDAGPTAGPAWFSASVSRVGDIQSLARELLRSGDSLHERLGEVMWVVEGDPFASAVPWLHVDPLCAEARVTHVDASPRDGEILAEVESAATCPLAFATNFTEDLRATVVTRDGRRLPAPVFPAYGSLAAVLAPEGASQVRLRAAPASLPWPMAWPAIGAGCCLGAACLALRGRSSAAARTQPRPDSSTRTRRSGRA